MVERHVCYFVGRDITNFLLCLESLKRNVGLSGMCRVRKKRKPFRKFEKKD